MGSSNVIRNALVHYRENELILASKLYRMELCDQISEAAFYKTLERMCKSGELVKIAKGTYHLPKVSKYGIVPPSEKEIIMESRQPGHSLRLCLLRKQFSTASSFHKIWSVGHTIT